MRPTSSNAPARRRAGGWLAHLLRLDRCTAECVLTRRERDDARAEVRQLRERARALSRSEAALHLELDCTRLALQQVLVARRGAGFEPMQWGEAMPPAADAAWRAAVGLPPRDGA